MQTPEVIYQYLLQYTDGTDDSDEAVERANQALYALMDLLDEAGRGGIFSAKDIPVLWNVVVRMELELEDEDSYNIEWSVKDQLLELIMNLVCMDGVSKWADTLAEMVDQGRQIDRAYMKTAVEHLLSFFLFGKTGEEGQNEAENRIAFGEALQRKIPDCRQMLLTYCEAYLDAWMDDYSVTRRECRKLEAAARQAGWDVAQFCLQFYCPEADTGWRAKHQRHLLEAALHLNLPLYRFYTVLLEQRGEQMDFREIFR